jgi:hypothetical protein
MTWLVFGSEHHELYLALLKARVVVFLLTGRTAIEAVSDVPSSWRELLTACTSVVPEQRPEASAVQGSLGG